MKILHVTPHMGGGVGTVIMGWIGKDKRHTHEIACLDTINEKASQWAEAEDIIISYNPSMTIWALRNDITEFDVVVCHFWDHPTLPKLFSSPIPDCRLVFWLHKNTLEAITLPVLPDMVIKTAPVQGAGKYIWSTGDMRRFFDMKPKAHEGFNIGYCGTVDYKKLHRDFIRMCNSIKIPDVRFTIVGENKTENRSSGKFNFVGAVDDVAPYLAEMDLFFYPLRADHYGTCEIALGEAMCAGILPICMNNPAEQFIILGSNVGVALTQEHAVRAIGYAYRNRDPLSRFSYLARERAKELYNIDTMIKQWNEVFEKMMKKPKVSHDLPME